MTTQQAIDHFGSKKKLADALGVHRSAITIWGDRMPMGRQYQVEVITNGKLKADRKAA